MRKIAGWKKKALIAGTAAAIAISGAVGVRHLDRVNQKAISAYSQGFRQQKIENPEEWARLSLRFAGKNPKKLGLSAKTMSSINRISGREGVSVERVLETLLRNELQQSTIASLENGIAYYSKKAVLTEKDSVMKKKFLRRAQRREQIRNILDFFLKLPVEQQREILVFIKRGNKIVSRPNYDSPY